MPLYEYQARDKKGKVKKGNIECFTIEEAKEMLRAQGVLVTSIALKKGDAQKNPLKGESLLSFTLELAQLLDAKVPLYESLMVLEEQYRDAAFHALVLSLKEQVKMGIPLSQAMGQYPKVFNRLYCSLVKAGESVGALDAVLNKLVELLKKQQKLKKEISNALIYPSILSGFSLIVIVLLLGFVVPAIEGIFEDRNLNAFTQFVIGISHFFRDYSLIFFPILILGIGGLIYWIRTPKGKLQIEKWILFVPKINTLVVETALARFCRTFSTLLKGGVPIIDAMRISREVMNQHVLEDEIRKAEEKVIEGKSLSRELSKSKWIPSMVSRMMSVGEDTGALVEMLQKIAEIYEEKVEKSLDRVMALAQPVILIVMGGIIGMVLLAILLPLTDISSLSVN